MSNRNRSDRSLKPELIRLAFLVLLLAVLSTAIGKKLFTQGVLAGSQIAARPIVENFRHFEDHNIQLSKARMTTTEVHEAIPSGQGPAPEVSLPSGGSRFLPAAPGEVVSFAVTASTPPADILIGVRGSSYYHDFHFHSDVSPPIIVTLPLGQSAKPGKYTALIVCKDRSGTVSKPAEVDFQIEARTAGGG